MQPSIASRADQDPTLSAIHNRLDALEDQVAALELKIERQRAGPAAKIILPPRAARPDDTSGLGRTLHRTDARIDTVGLADRARKGPIIAGAGLIAATILMIEIAT